MMDHEGYLGVVRVEAVQITLDEAALLMNELIGGPAVWVEPDLVTVLPVTGATFRSRKITVVAAEAGEAQEVLSAVGRLAQDGRLESITRLVPHAYRWHDGDLARVIWRETDGAVRAIGQEEWAGTQ